MSEHQGNMIEINIFKIHVKTDECKQLLFSFCKIKPNFECNLTFPIDLAPNEKPFVVKSIGKLYLELETWCNLTKFRKRFVCVFL